MNGSFNGMYVFLYNSIVMFMMFGDFYTHLLADDIFTVSILVQYDY